MPDCWAPRALCMLCEQCARRFHTAWLPRPGIALLPVAFAGDTSKHHSALSLLQAGRHLPRHLNMIILMPAIINTIHSSIYLKKPQNKQNFFFMLLISTSMPLM